MKPELHRVAYRCLSQLAQIEPHHHVLVVTDSLTRPIAEVFAAAATAMAKEVVVMTMELRRKHGEEPPRAVAAAMATSDVIVQAVSYALTHTDATREALARKAQVFVLRGITEEMMLSDLMKVDYQELRRVTELVAERLSNGEVVHLTSEAGTDLRFSIKGRSAMALAGGTRPGHFGGARSGEAALAPVEGTAEGVIIIEHSMDNIGRLDIPIRLKIVRGRVTDIQGGLAAEHLQRLLAESDEQAANLAEFAIGTNPNARLSGNLAEDKKVKGSVHVALGDNVSLGGLVKSNLHLDGMILRPTVKVDGKPIVKEGQLWLGPQ